MIPRYEPPLLVDLSRGCSQLGFGICSNGWMYNNPGCYTGTSPACHIGCFNSYDCQDGYYVCGISTFCCAGNDPFNPMFDCIDGWAASACITNGNCPTNCCNTGDGGSEYTGRLS